MANIDLTGANGSITWTTLTSGTTAPTVGNCVVVRSNVRRPVSLTTRPGSLMQRVTVGEFRGGLTVRCVATDDGTPPVPTTTNGTATVYLKTTATAQNYAFKVVIVGFAFGYNSLDGSSPAFVDYECVLSSTATTDTVVAT